MCNGRRGPILIGMRTTPANQDYGGPALQTLGRPLLEGCPVSPITIEHHRSASACCMECESAWAADGWVSVLAVLARAAEHAIETGHAVAEHVADDAVIHPMATTIRSGETR